MGARGRALLRALAALAGAGVFLFAWPAIAPGVELLLGRATLLSAAFAMPEGALDTIRQRYAPESAAQPPESSQDQSPSRPPAPQSSRPEPPASGSGEAEGVLLELMTAARSELGHPMSPEEAEKLSRAGPEELLTQSVLLREALEVQASRELLAGAKAFRRRRESARSGGGQKC